MRANVTNIKDIKPGLRIIGIHVEVDNVLTDRIFDHGSPWEVTKVEYTHDSPQHEYLGIMKPPRTHYRLHAKSASGFEQTLGTLSDNEGVIEDSCAGLSPKENVSDRKA